MISRQRWIDHADTPPWWKGMIRVSWRFTFDIALIMAGLVGVLDTDLRKDANITVAAFVLADLLSGILDLTFFSKTNND